MMAASLAFARRCFSWLPEHVKAALTPRELLTFEGKLAIVIDYVDAVRALEERAADARVVLEHYPHERARPEVMEKFHEFQSAPAAQVEHAVRALKALQANQLELLDLAAARAQGAQAENNQGAIESREAPTAPIRGTTFSDMKLPSPVGDAPCAAPIETTEVP